mgnify:FL=1|tara:strand:+ start:36 stop:353 length:318 start_codon:yes stop_codon:yes gene_type:complete
MNVTDFFNRLDGVSTSYHWDIDKKRVVAKIRSGPNRGFTLNPVTALAHKSGFGLFNNTRDGTENAANLLGLPRKFARSVYSATLGTHNRGNTQVIRGRIRSALEV